MYVTELIEKLQEISKNNPVSFVEINKIEQLGNGDIKIFADCNCSHSYCECGCMDEFDEDEDVY